MTVQMEPRSIEDREARIDEIRAELQNLGERFDGVRFDDESRERWNALNQEKSEHEGAVVELRKRATRLRELAGNPNATQQAGDQRQAHLPGWWPAGRRGVPSLHPGEDELRRLHRAALTGGSVRVEMRATVLTSDTGADQLAVPLSQRGRTARRIAAAAGIPAEQVDGVTSVEFPVFGAGAAGITAEGVAKTEYDAITPGSETPQMITIWSDTTRQTLLTMTGFEAKLRTVLSAKVANREDLLLISQVIGTTGILNPTGTLSAELVLEAAAQVAAGDVGVEPNLVAVNPADVPVLLGPDVGAGGTASPPFASFLPTIHGMTVYPSNHVTAGEAVLGAWGAGSRFIVGVSPVFLVDAASGIKTNTVTILLEEAVTLAVDEPQAFAHITAA